MCTRFVWVLLFFCPLFLFWLVCADYRETRNITVKQETVVWVSSTRLAQTCWLRQNLHGSHFLFHCNPDTLSQLFFFFSSFFFFLFFFLLRKHAQKANTQKYNESSNDINHISSRSAVFLHASVEARKASIYDSPHSPKQSFVTRVRTCQSQDQVLGANNTCRKETEYSSH